MVLPARVTDDQCVSGPAYDHSFDVAICGKNMYSEASKNKATRLATTVFRSMTVSTLAHYLEFGGHHLCAISNPRSHWWHQAHWIINRRTADDATVETAQQRAESSEP